MNSIREVKASIYKTECKNYINDGMWLSDPMPTNDGSGLVDNYFVYSRNREGTKVNGPFLTFGIYTEQNKTAYINDNLSGQKPRDNMVSGGADIYAGYEKDYLQIREWVMKDIDGDKKEVLNRYIDGLSKVGGTGILEIYKESFPSFFEWADKYK